MKVTCRLSAGVITISTLSSGEEYEIGLSNSRYSRSESWSSILAFFRSFKKTIELPSATGTSGPVTSMRILSIFNPFIAARTCSIVATVAFL